MFAPLFLHFSTIYPVRYHLFEERRWRTVLMYVPAFVLLGFTAVIFLHDELAKILPHQLLDYSPNFLARFYKASFIHFTVALIASAVSAGATFHHQQEHRRASAIEVGGLGIDAGHCAVHPLIRGRLHHGRDAGLA